MGLDVGGFCDGSWAGGKQPGPGSQARTTVRHQRHRRKHGAGSCSGGLEGSALLPEGWSLAWGLSAAGTHQARTRATGRSGFPAPEAGRVPGLPAVLPRSPSPLARPREEFLRLALSARRNVTSRRGIQLWRCARLQRGRQLCPLNTAKEPPPRANQDRGRSRAGRGPRPQPMQGQARDGPPSARKVGPTQPPLRLPLPPPGCQWEPRLLLAPSVRQALLLPRGRQGEYGICGLTLRFVCPTVRVAVSGPQSSDL